MTANELADWIEINDFYNQYEIAKHSVIVLRQQAQIIERYHNMLRDKDVEIADLKIANQDLKYQLIQKSGEQVLNDFKELSDEEIFRLGAKHLSDDIPVFARAIIKASRGEK
jgi:hypothetical protein